MTTNSHRALLRRLSRRDRQTTSATRPRLPVRRRRLTRQSFDTGVHLGVMDPRTTRTFPVPEPIKALGSAPFPPTRQHINMNTQRCSDFDVASPIGGHQHNPGSHHLTMSSRITARTATRQLVYHPTGQHHQRGTRRHTGLRQSLPANQSRPPTYTDVIIGMPTSETRRETTRST